ncbi:MAG: hypothetical protein DYG93_13585 [Leptolyngbya sp. PLA2]|nr:hypothetical protein [Leptolyngbya sp.]MCE7972679.1 hypothetical protein [Leptolyngbya sp. PL-A2]MCQ3939548.1 hypothetical protein [cyanobacterium CYA1]MCZ7632196.1 hypothetical protein [Phycisphaerales bacterium]MDL1903804.1 hypothetical protein [Synechococcales cyanobacterium CNB]GIK18532.1 MAG: hypothetical protein BroJett004_06960 [Planctomycetota bacterium]
MPCIVKSLVRMGVIGTVVGGAVLVPAVVIAGPDRVAALFTQARHSINSKIDATIDDPIALRQQLRALEAELPRKIAAVQGDLAEVTHNVQQLERELLVSRKVISLADADLGQMQDLLARAESARSENGFSVVRVRLDDRSFSLDEAYAKANQISQLRSAYADRAADIERDLSLLRSQQDRLSELLGQFESERVKFQNELWQLDRQVDAIARNTRMEQMLTQRQATMDKYDRYSAGSLDQVQGRIAKILAEQEARLTSLAGRSTVDDYKARAQLELDTTIRAGQALRGSGSALPGAKAIEITPPVIEVGPESDKPAEPARPLASRDR